MDTSKFSTAFHRGALLMHAMGWETQAMTDTKVTFVRYVDRGGHKILEEQTFKLNTFGPYRVALECPDDDLFNRLRQTGADWIAEKIGPDPSDQEPSE